MAKYDKTKKYWLQLKEDWFEEDAIKWLEEQKNGKEYSLFYMKLMCKSIKTNGILIRQVGKMLVPYNPEALGDLTRTDMDTVIVAMKLLEEIGLVEILEDGAIYIEAVSNMIGCTTISALKKQEQLKNKKQKDIGWNKGGKNSTKDKDITIIKDKDKDKKETYDTILESEKEEEVKECLLDFIKMRKIIKRPLTNRALKMLINKLNNLASNKENKIKILEQSILNCWQDIYELKNKGVNNGRSKQDDGQSYDGDLFKTN